MVRPLTQTVVRRNFFLPFACCYALDILTLEAINSPSNPGVIYPEQSLFSFPLEADEGLFSLTAFAKADRKTS